MAMGQMATGYPKKLRFGKKKSTKTAPAENPRVGICLTHSHSQTAGMKGVLKPSLWSFGFPCGKLLAKRSPQQSFFCQRESDSGQ